MGIIEGNIAEKVAGGTWSLRVPIPGSPLGATLVYLLEGDTGPVLIDAGWHATSSWEALTAGIAEAGFAVADIRGVLVTHHHPDHHGLAGEIRDASGAWIAMHREDAAVVQRHRRHLSDDGEGRFERVAAQLHTVGVPVDEIEALLASPEDMAPPALPDREIEDGQRLDVPGRELRAVWTPGHSPGHTCFHLPAERRLLAGDHLLPTITPHVGLYEFDFDGDAVDPLGGFLSSLEQLLQLDVDEVWPAHQHRFGDVEGRVREIVAHHDARLRELERALEDGGEMTVWELAGCMTWNRDWDELTPMMRRIAAGEAGAHLRHLQLLGHVELASTNDPVRFRRVPAGEPAGS